MVVNPAHRSAVGMCQLHFNSVSRPFVLVHNRAEFMPESVTAFQTFIADLFDHKQYRILADWLLLIVAPAKTNSDTGLVIELSLVRSSTTWSDIGTT